MTCKNITIVIQILIWLAQQIYQNFIQKKNTTRVGGHKPDPQKNKSTKFEARHVGFC